MSILTPGLDLHLDLEWDLDLDPYLYLVLALELDHGLRRGSAPPGSWHSGLL